MQADSHSFRSRHMGLEYLRCIAAAMVVINHAWYMPEEATSLHIIVTALVYSVVLVAVPLFVLLSGAFLIPNVNNSKAVLFWKHSFKKLFPLSVVFFVLAFFWQTNIWHDYQLGLFNSGELIKKIINWYASGAVAPLWYLCMLPGLYFSVPVLTRVWFGIGSGKFLFLCIVLYGLGIYLTLTEISLPHPFSALLWMGYFVLGAMLLYLVSIRKMLSCKTLAVLIIMLLLISWLYLYTTFSLDGKIYINIGKTAYWFNLALAPAIFCLFAQWNPEPKKWVIVLSRLSFLVYLTHVPCQRIIRAVLFHAGGIDLLIYPNVLSNILFSTVSLIFAVMSAFLIKFLTKKCSYCAKKIFIRHEV